MEPTSPLSTPYRSVELNVAEPEDTRRVRAMTAVFAVAGLLLFIDFFEPSTRVDGRPAWLFFGCRTLFTKAEVYPLFLLACNLGFRAALSAYVNAPPSRTVRMWTSAGVATVAALQVVLFVTPATGESLALSCPDWSIIAFGCLLVAAVLVVRAFQREGWEGWAYAQGAFAFAFIGSVYSHYMLGSLRGWIPRTQPLIGAWQYVGAGGLMLAASCWGMALFRGLKARGP
jgi:hypothetical protein